MEEEVTGAEQAQMAVKLADNVRQLIREEVKLALEDYTFVNTVGTWALMPKLMFGAASHDAFRTAVREVMITQMQRP